MNEVVAHTNGTSEAATVVGECSRRSVAVIAAVLRVCSGNPAELGGATLFAFAPVRHFLDT